MTYSPHQNLELIELEKNKQSKSRRIGHIIVSLVYIVVFSLIVYAIATAQTKGGGLATGLSFLGAATVVALQSFIASFFTFLYITLTNQYDVGDVIKIGDPRMTSIGEVMNLGVFTTTIKELDEELMFTGRHFSLPNHIFFTAGVYNYTKINLLFWYIVNTKIRINKAGCEATLEQYRTIVNKCHHTLIEDNPQRYGSMHHHRPKYKYTLTESGINIETRINAHFYNVLELNNMITCSLVNAHRAGEIVLVEHKDYQGVYTG